MIRILSCVLALLLCAGWAGVARAQERSMQEAERRVDAEADEETEGDEEGDPDVASEAEPAKLDEVIVTATRHEAPLFDVPYSGEVRSGDEITMERQSRSLPESLQDIPSVMVQKTATGQGSPFLRGFTAYRNVFLIDGIRLNNSTFRSGPNQYWATVDHLAVDRLEVVLGPSSVQYGSDAIGGAVNVIPRRRESFEPGFNLGGRALFRYSSAEDSFIERVEVEGNQGETIGFLGGISMKSFGDLDAGSGELPNTAYDQFDGDFRIDYRPGDGLEWTIAYQHSSQDDVPRTHRTTRAVSFHSSTVGSELRRDLDQRRDLVYSRWTLTDPTTLYDRASFTVSYQRQEQKRDRLRTGDRRDLSGFDVNSYGAIAQIEKDTSIGYWTVGADYYYDDVDSFRRNFSGGSLSSVDVQGPLGDDANYNLLGIYAQNEFEAFGIDWISGVRYTYARASADSVDNPEVDGSDPSTPGNVISITDSWDQLVGSLRGSFPVIENNEGRVFFGVSQGFRAPSLHDLTSFESTSVFEIPTDDLDPENYLSCEVGFKLASGPVSGRIAGYWTFIDDMIVRSPTGQIIEDTPVVRKDNVGDGHVAGLELEGGYAIDEEWSLFGAISYQSGKVDQFRFPSGEKVDKPIDRVMPVNGIAGVRYEPPKDGYFIELFTRFSDEADRLSLRDESDTERIPPGGTPGWATVNVRGGYQINDRVSLAAALENIGDKDYRIHGSGQNEAGINFITTLEVRF